MSQNRDMGHPSLVSVLLPRELGHLPNNRDIIRQKNQCITMRYKLDDLGAYQFEQLAQSLLKAHAGLAVESWGRRSDHGRDAYTPNALHFPNKDIETAGPFLFQVKFVEGANAAGAKPAAALSDSISKEIASIKQRRTASVWTEPSHFTFLTNSPIEASLRDEIRQKFQSVLSSSVVITYGGDDLCDLLDQAPDVYRSFPQLLSIRDLDALIRGALTSESVARSTAAIEIARELVPVFAPTTNYEKAWSVLRRHHFAVLEGPPEVGKTAIAWMVGLSQVGVGWEAIYSQGPSDFFNMYDRSRKQIFIADDAFGRTEYDPTRASKWEAELDLVLRRVDADHWLIWTSRKHILERAVYRMDVTGKARSFPDPGAVLVDVRSLSTEERATVLFRHARAANLEQDAKELIRRHAPQIINNPDFTPERIRRFVCESLPTLVAKIRLGTLSHHEIFAKVDEAIKNPTKQMRLTFRGLGVALKWYLISMLEMPQSRSIPGSPGTLEEGYVRYCPDERRIPFEEATQQLNEAFVHIKVFVRIGQGVKHSVFADWIHPSYRDLVIDELAADPELRTQFLKRASLEGIKLAVSDTGGQEGLRRLPLMVSSESWNVLEERALTIVRECDQDRDLLEVFPSAAKRSNSKDLEPRWERLISAVCRAVKEKWDGTARRLEAADLAAFRGARSAINSGLELPGLLGTWLSLGQEFRENLAAHPSFDQFDFDSFDELTRFAEEAEACIPGFLHEHGLPDQFESATQRMFEKAERGFSALQFGGEDEDREEFASDVSRLANVLGRISKITSSMSLDASAREFFGKADIWAIELEGMAATFAPYEYEDDYDRFEDSGSKDDEFDLNALFAEL